MKTIELQLSGSQRISESQIKRNTVQPNRISSIANKTITLVSYAFLLSYAVYNVFSKSHAYSEICNKGLFSNRPVCLAIGSSKADAYGFLLLCAALPFSLYALQHKTKKQEEIQ